MSPRLGYSGDNEPSISLPNRNLAAEKLMGGHVNVVPVLAMKVMHCCSSAHRHNLILYAEVLESEKNSEQGVL